MARRYARSLVVAAVLLGGVALLATTAPAVAAQDDEQQLEVTYEYELAPDVDDPVRITLTLHNPDEIDDDISLGMDGWETTTRMEEGSNSLRLKPVEGAETASVTYTEDQAVERVRGEARTVGEDGSWAITRRAYERVDGEFEVDREHVVHEGQLVDVERLDEEYLVMGGADIHTAETDAGSITVFGAPEAMAESPSVVAETLAAVSNEIEAGVLDHDVTAYGVPSVEDASGVALGTETHYTQIPESVSDGGNTWFHEYVHNTENVNYDGFRETPMSWFTEGYADYGSHLYGLRAGHGTYQEFVQDMESWNQDPPVVLANEDEWESDSVDAEYNQGARVLAAIDYELRNASRHDPTLDATLDDVVQELHERDDVTLDDLTTIIEEDIGAEGVAAKAETWTTTEHTEDVFEPMGAGEFEELYVEAPELEGVTTDRTIVDIHSDAQDPADPILLDEGAETLVVYGEGFSDVAITGANDEVIADTRTGTDPYTTVDAAEFDRSTTYEVTVETLGGDVTTQHVSTLEPVEGAVPRDLNGDGLHRDLNGDGSVTNSDVTLFFQNQHAPEVNDYPDAYDFDGDGTVGQSDVLHLFDEL